MIVMPIIVKKSNARLYQHPFIYLPGVKFSHLSKILDCLYQGEVKINQNELDDFLSVAHDLTITGLVLEESKLLKFGKKKIQQQENWINSVHYKICYACQNCDYTTSTKGSLTQHTKNVHML